jgi:alkyl sulfatase BDS1-like metallo-beta-lactamase superfamily hydrolase
MTFSIPEKKLYDGAENMSQQMHNLLPVRGAKVRDALRWSNYMEQALEQTKGAEIYMASHNWPVWGNANIQKLHHHAP